MIKYCCDLWATQASHANFLSRFLLCRYSITVLPLADGWCLKHLYPGHSSALSWGSSCHPGLLFPVLMFLSAYGSTGGHKKSRSECHGVGMKQPPPREGQELSTFLSLSGQSQSISIEHLLRWQTWRSSVYPHAGLIINIVIGFLPFFSLTCFLSLSKLTTGLQILVPGCGMWKNIKHKHILRKNMSNSSEDIETMLSWKEEEGMFIYATHTLVGA